MCDATRMALRKVGVEYLKYESYNIIMSYETGNMDLVVRQPHCCVNTSQCNSCREVGPAGLFYRDA